MAAKLTACRPEPQKRLRLTPVTSIGQPCREHRVAGDVRPLLAGLRDAADDHVLDLGTVDTGAVGERVERLREELLRMDPGKGSLARLAAAARRADGIEDVRVSHGTLPFWSEKNCKRTNGRTFSGSRLG